MAALAGCGKSYEQVRDAYYHGDHANAAAMAQRCPDPRCAALACRVALAGGSTEDARRALDRVPRDSPWRFYLEGRLVADTAAGYDQAEALFRKAIDGAGGVELATEARTRLALLRARRGELDEAEAMIREAIQQAESGSDWDRAIAWTNHGFFLNRRRSTPDSAIPALLRARQFAQRAGARVIEAGVLDNLASCYLAVGEMDRALATIEQVLPLHEAAGSVSFQLHALTMMGLIQQYRRDPAALASHRRATELARSTGQPGLERLTATNLSLAYLENGDYESADRANKQLAALFEKYPQLPGRDYLKLNQGYAALGLSRPGEAAELFRQVSETAAEPSLQWEAQAGLAHAAERSGSLDLARRHFEQALALAEGMQASQLREESRLAYLNRVMGFYRDYVRLLIAAGDDETALTVEDSSRAHSLSSRGQPVSIGELRRLCARTRTVLLSYWISSRGSHVRVIDAAGHWRAPVDASPEQLARLVRSWLTFLERDRGDPTAGRVPAAGEELFRLLLEPVRERIPPGSRVVIVADGPLHSLNFETLPTPGDPPRLWLREATISVAPSLGLLLDPLRSRPLARSLLLLGDPLAAGTEFPALARAGAEIDAVHQHFRHARVFRGPQATPRAFSDAGPGAYSHIHFTSHAVANGESPLDSFVQLSPHKDRSRLFARDIARQSLSAELVTISACRGAGSRSYSGEGLVGLGWAFLRAGAANVIAGLWDVPDDATAALMESLYEEMASGRTPAEALARAKRKMAEGGGRHAKPFYWASLQVYERSPGRAK